jgi:hypothetical protein
MDVLRIHGMTLCGLWLWNELLRPWTEPNNLITWKTMINLCAIEQQSNMNASQILGK